MPIHLPNPSPNPSRLGRNPSPHSFADPFLRASLSSHNTWQTLDLHCPTLQGGTLVDHVPAEQVIMLPNGQKMTMAQYQQMQQVRGRALTQGRLAQGRLGCAEAGREAGLTTDGRLIYDCVGPGGLGGGGFGGVAASDAACGLLSGTPPTTRHLLPPR